MRQRGFSLIELMVTVAVLAILLAIGLPSFQGSMRSNRVATASNELVAALNLTRSEAIRSTRGAGICPSVSGADCDGDDWSDGWIVWADANESGTFDDDENVLRIREAFPNLAFDGDAEAVAFDSRGRRRNAGVIQISLQPSECPEGHELRRAFSINAAGQVAMEREGC